MLAAKALVQFGDGWFPGPGALRAEEFEPARILQRRAAEWASVILWRQERGRIIARIDSADLENQSENEF